MINDFNAKLSGAFSMARALRFSDAVSGLHQLQPVEDDDEIFEARDEMERAVLDHIPSNFGEAASMLVVVRDTLGEGARSDGRDLAALQTLIRWCRSLENLASGSVREGVQDVAYP